MVDINFVTEPPLPHVNFCQLFTDPRADVICERSLIASIVVLSYLDI